MENTQNPQTMEKYFLFGGEAVTKYRKGESLENTPFGLYKWEEGKSSPLDLLDAYCGWENWIIISKQEWEDLFMKSWN